MEYKKDYYGFIYKWTNQRNKKYYIGSHHGSTDDGYVGSGVWFRRAYKKEPYNFTREILEYVTVNEPIKTLELEDSYLIEQCEVGNKDKCYNIARASRRGSGTWSIYGKTEEEKQEIYQRIAETLKNKSFQEKQAALAKARATIESQPEKYAAAIEKGKETKRKWSPERKAEMARRMAETLAKNPEIKEKALQKFQNTILSRSEERKLAIATRQKDALTEDVRKKLGKSVAAARARRTVEEVAEVNNKISKALKERDPELKKESYKKGAESFKNRTPEQKAESEAIRKAKWLAKREQTIAKISAAKRKDKPDVCD